MVIALVPQLLFASVIWDGLGQTVVPIAVVTTIQHARGELVFAMNAMTGPLDNFANSASQYQFLHATCKNCLI